jgi:hypothetical protein
MSPSLTEDPSGRGKGLFARPARPSRFAASVRAIAIGSEDIVLRPSMLSTPAPVVIIPAFSCPPTWRVPEKSSTGSWKKERVAATVHLEADNGPGLCTSGILRIRAQIRVGVVLPSQ